MSSDACFFSVCGVVLIVGGWWLQPHLNRLFAKSPRDSILRRFAWLPGVAGLCQWIIFIAWILVFLAMAGEFNKYMFGPFPEQWSALCWLRLLFAIAFMLGFVGTVARWAWHRGYNSAKEENKGHKDSN
jgi:vacuolar-type H+-ATPase subunit I/STV1